MGRLETASMGLKVSFAIAHSAIGVKCPSIHLFLSTIMGSDVNIRIGIVSFCSRARQLGSDLFPRADRNQPRVSSSSAEQAAVPHRDRADARRRHPTPLRAIAASFRRKRWEPVAARHHRPWRWRRSWRLWLWRWGRWWVRWLWLGRAWAEPGVPLVRRGHATPRLRTRKARVPIAGPSWCGTLVPTQDLRIL
jgi:hypothetical protein|eukprot:COSAG01_NODE_9334_length_2481_cov_1.465995_3_plen_193_part_00